MQLVTAGDVEGFVFFILKDWAALNSAKPLFILYPDTF